MKHFIVLVFALLATACATPYQQVGTTVAGGFSTNRITTDVFEINFSGNGFTDPKRAYDFAFLRAAEVALEYNFPFFSLTGHRDDTSTEIIQGIPTTYTTGSYGYGTYSGTTTTYSNNIPVTKPDITLHIFCLESPDALGKHAGKIYVAEDVRRELRQKYRLDKQRRAGGEPSP